MKVRNCGSKAFHRKQSVLFKNFSITELIHKLEQAKSQNRYTCKTKIKQCSRKFMISVYKQIISKCYNQKQAQQSLCKAMKISFIQGPVSLSQIPQSFLQFPYMAEGQRAEIALTQLSYLFQFLKKTKEYYYCWVIYFHQQFKILTLKMLKKYQVDQNSQIFMEDCMVGIFVDRKIQKKLNYQSGFEESQLSNSQSQNLNKLSKSNTNSCHDHLGRQCKSIKDWENNKYKKMSLLNTNQNNTKETKQKSQSKLKSKSNIRLKSRQFIKKQKQGDFQCSLNSLNCTSKTLKTLSNTSHTNNISKSMSSTFVSICKQNDQNTSDHQQCFKKTKNNKKVSKLSASTSGFLNDPNNLRKQLKMLKIKQKKIEFESHLNHDNSELAFNKLKKQKSQQKNTFFVTKSKNKVKVKSFLYENDTPELPNLSQQNYKKKKLKHNFCHQSFQASK